MKVQPRQRAACSGPAAVGASLRSFTTLHGCAESAVYCTGRLYGSTLWSKRPCTPTRMSAQHRQRCARPMNGCLPTRRHCSWCRRCTCSLAPRTNRTWYGRKRCNRKILWREAYGTPMRAGLPAMAAPRFTGYTAVLASRTSSLLQGGMAVDQLPNPGRIETTRHMHWPASDWPRLPAVANARCRAGVRCDTGHAFAIRESPVRQSLQGCRG